MNFNFIKNMTVIEFRLIFGGFHMSVDKNISLYDLKQKVTEHLGLNPESGTVDLYYKNKLLSGSVETKLSSIWINNEYVIGIVLRLKAMDHKIYHDNITSVVLQEKQKPYISEEYTMMINVENKYL